MCNAIHLLVGERGMKHYPLYPMFIPLITQKSIIRWCGSMVEQLTCNQQVEGSIPFTSSTQAPYGCLKFMGRLQSGQMQRTVNPSTTSSMVRIHPCPP